MDMGQFMEGLAGHRTDVGFSSERNEEWVLKTGVTRSDIHFK